MPGTIEGGRKAAATNKKKYGKEFYANIGRKGGKNGHTGGFAANPELAREAGRKGGKISKRGPAKRFSADKIAKIKEELAEAEAEELKSRIRLLKARLENAEHGTTQ
jgi:general stress protein YciG